MKICSKCGAQQGDARLYCVDCGERLGRSLSGQEEKKASEELGTQIENLYNQGDPLHVSLSDRILGGIHLAGMAALLVVLALYVGDVFPAGKAYPEAVPMAMAGLLFFLAGTVEAFFPQVSWALERFRMSFWANGTEDITPSHFYFVCRRISIAAFLVLGGLILAALLYGLLQAPAPAPDAAEILEELAGVTVG